MNRFPIFAVSLLFSVSAQAQNAWTTGQELAHNIPEFSEFGKAVAIPDDGSTIAVGAPFDPTDGVAAGGIYLYERIGDQWSFAARVANPDLATHREFGISVSLPSTGQLFVGANDDAGASGRVSASKTRGLGPWMSK